MGEMASLWGYAEHLDMDQLGQKLLYTTFELEKLKSETMEVMQKNKEYVDQLIIDLKCALHQRDEAMSQLEKLITKTISPTNSETFPHFQPINGNSSITESNSLSESFNYSSPTVESLFDPLEFSNMSIQSTNLDEKESFKIDNLIKGRVLPQNGMFLQAVREAGPLLKTLLVAGPLPIWRNPPQMQSFQIPPVSIRGVEKPAYANFGCFGLGKRQRLC